MLLSRFIRQTAIALAAASCLTAFAAAQQPVIPVEAWADTQEINDLVMSPNGNRIAMLQRQSRGDFHRLVVFNTDDIQGSMEIVNFDEEARPYFLSWEGNDRLIVTVIIERVRAGDPITVWRILALDPNDTSEVVDLLESSSNARNELDDAAATLYGGYVADSLPYDDDHVIMALRTDVFGIADYYKVNVETGARQRVLRGNDRYGGFAFDWDGEVRMAFTYDPDGPRVVSVAREKGDTDWIEVGALDARERHRFSLMGFYNEGAPNEAIIIADIPGEDTQGIFRIDVTRPANRNLIFQQAGYEPRGIIRSPWRPDRGRMIGFNYANGTRQYSYILDDDWAELYGSLEATFPDRNVFVEAVSDDRETTLLRTSGPQDPGTYYLMRGGRLAKIADVDREIDRAGLAPAREVIVTARDGRPVPALATIPEGEGPFPGIVMPHGGPWVRESYGYDSWAAMLANRGYVVVQPNYRGSSGLGRDHWIAGDNEWGQAMQDDIEDSLLHFVEEGIVDGERLGIFGWSYGGYAAMAAAARNNGIFNCSAAGAGVSDIARIRGGLSGNRYYRRFQRPTITGFSPIDHVDQVSIPMLVVHGDADRIVPVDHSRRWVSGLERAGVWHQYVEIDDMRHSPFYYEQNMQWFPALLEFFETQCGFND